MCDTTTTETQRTQRLHRENSVYGHFLRYNAIDGSSPNPGISLRNDNKIHSICPVDFKCAPLLRFDFLHKPVSSRFLGQQETDNLGAALQGRGKAKRFRRLLLTITVRNERFFLNPL